jgi:hypothetical protein
MEFDGPQALASVGQKKKNKVEGKVPYERFEPVCFKK